jgi:hypothetical protein
LSGTIGGFMRAIGLTAISAGLEEGGELPDADQVAGDPAVGEVLGPQVSLEGVAEAEGSTAVHGRTVAQ